VVAVEHVSDVDTRRYGIVETEPVSDCVYRVLKLMEKPQPEQTTSRLGIVGRYIFTPEIFDMIARTPPGAVNEIQITDAIQLILNTQKFYAYELEGERYDAGTPSGWLKANIAFALKRPDIGPELGDYLRQLS
jgi:UTP--glucose-1-phosphate uridylyltransferase